MGQNIEPQIVTHSQLKSGNFAISNDKFGIASYILTSSRVKTLTTCPFIEDGDSVAFYLILVDGVVAGRETYFQTKMKIGDDIVTAEAASAFEVAEPFRHLAIGADIVMATFSRSRFFVGAGVSTMALPLDRKLKFHVLEFPRLMLLRNSRSILASKSIPFLSGIVNIPIRIFNNIKLRKSSKLAEKYLIKKVDIVPSWVDGMVLNDGHKYAEYHNHEWLQWNLDNNFRGEKRDRQAFYCIFKDEEPYGFYMIKERFREQAGGTLRNVLIGSIVEWGSKDENRLSESDIILLSLRNFSEDVDIIETATANDQTISTIKKYGFIQHGMANIVFKDKTKTCKDASDINLWRVRFGYGDLILT